MRICTRICKYRQREGLLPAIRTRVIALLPTHYAIAKRIAELTFAAVCLWGALCEAASGRYEPEFAHYESPAPSVHDEGLPLGSVRISFDVESSGSVSNLVIEHSSHAVLIEAVRRAVSLWRFKPWTSSAYAPEQIRDMRNLFFTRTWETPDQLRQASLRLRRVSCAAFIKGQRERRSQLSVNEEFALGTPDLTKELIYEAVQRGRFTYYQGVELIDLFERSLRAVKEACLEQPGKRYAEMLPAGVLGAIRDAQLQNP